MTNVTDFTGKTRHHRPVAKILADAAGAGLTTAVVIGWDKNNKIYFASSEPDGAEAGYLLDQAKLELLMMGRGG